MWSFGCMLAEFYFGKPLFPGNSDLQQLIYMIAVLGFPPPHVFDHNKLEIELIKEKKYCERDEQGLIKRESIVKFQ